MRVLQISADRSKRGILFPGTDAFKRQEAYAQQFGNLDIIAFSLASDGAQRIEAGALRIFPTNSASKLFWGWDAKRLARGLPKPDVVSVQDPFETGLIGCLVARWFGVPLHAQVHTDFLSPEYARHSLLNRIRVCIARRVLRRAARIRVMSGRMKAGIEALGIEKPVSILPIFVDVARFRSLSGDPILADRFSKFSHRVVVVARLEPEKHVALAIRSFAARAPKTACLIIVGEGSEARMLATLAGSLGIAGRVFFEQGREAPPYVALADLILVPSKYEGYGLVIVEALAAGKPVLATDVGIAREAGAIVTDEKHFAEALGEWFKNGPRTQELNGYPYRNFDEYVRAYCDDIRACTSGKLSV